MRGIKCAAALLPCILGGCSALWGGLAVPAPENCVVSGTPCAQGQECNPQTQLCEPTLALSQITPARGLSTAATPIQITGTGFTPEVTLTWNGSPLLPLTMTSQTELQAMAPANPGGGWLVTVQASRPGLVASRGDLFSYYSANPTFTATFPSWPNNQGVFALSTAPLSNPPRANLLLVDGSMLMHVVSLSSDGLAATITRDLVLPSAALGLLGGDLNGDGLADIMLTASGGAYWIAGTADHGFAAYQPLHRGFNAGALLALGDVDHDGVPDLVAVDTSSNQPAVLAHGGTTFAELALPGTPPTLQSLAVGELDGQPGDDIVVGFQNVNSNLGVLTGGTGASTYLSVPIAPCQDAQVQAVRFRNGPTHDLLLSCADQVHVLLNAGNGTFTSGYSMTLTGQQSFTGTPVVADFDGDGNPDVVLLRVDPSISPQPEAFLLQNASGDGMLKMVDLLVSVPNPMGAILVGADLTGDGKPDLVVADRMPANQAPFHILLNVSP